MSMSFLADLMDAYRKAGIPLIALRFTADAYPPSQLKEATRVARGLGRGVFWLLEDPADG